MMYTDEQLCFRDVTREQAPIEGWNMQRYVSKDHNILAEICMVLTTDILSAMWNNHDMLGKEGERKMKQHNSLTPFKVLVQPGRAPKFDLKVGR